MKQFVILFLLITASNILFAQQNRLSEEDAVLIAEAIRFQDQIGPEIWKDWEIPNLPVVYKAEGFDYYINHPNTPEDAEIYFDEILNDSITIVQSTDSNTYQAAFPLNGAWTIVISKLDTSYDSALWFLKFTHECFHILQSRINKERVVNPFVNEYTGFHELNFPFNYDKKVLNAALRVEAEGIFNSITQKDSVSPGVVSRLFNSYQEILKYVIADSLQYKYKQWQEWMEGISRYTEREAAALAKDSGFEMSERFVSFYPETDFEKTWREHYLNMLNPIRFIGEGVKGRVMFYYSGMGKGYLLDKINPDWKNKYFKFNLDDLIQQANVITQCSQ